ncbi:hypothetical protein AX016_2686 [Cellulophaga sp. RHA19]|uniref:hypothetical protein n=1 Tax=Cellulophaga sp. RHA19 TaxID=1798237 RepID=UPI000C2C3EC4|nr:hypothetical protein [Cellulophaga sp. RHA19]PKB44467.1 hypothetical protein AX016_2686 [Cellulophaga sp. RHA19]
MTNYETTKIRQYEKFIRNILTVITQKIDLEKLDNEKKSFLAKIKERLCLEKDDSWKFLKNSLDVIGDSEFAINVFLNTFLKKKSVSNQKYLELYGVLSASYIQQQAILELSTLFKIDDRRKIKESFDNLDITFLRHSISAHPTNYNNEGTKVCYSFVRSSFYSTDGLLEIMDEDSNIQKYNIIDSIIEYSAFAEKHLENVCRKLISNCYKTAKLKYDELNIELNEISNN